MLKRLRDRQLWSKAIACLQALARPPQRAVYVVQYGENYRIGLSFSPARRIKAFMLPEVVASMRVYWVPKAKEFEKALLQKYAVHRIFEKWFRLPETALNEMDAFAEQWKNNHEKK
jgi:hypothetical protein